MRSVGTVSRFLIVLGLAAVAGPAWPASDPERPKDVGLVEHVERRLFPLNVQIRALAPQYRFEAAHLTKADFSVMFDLENLPSSRFELDNFCPGTDDERSPESPEIPESSKHLLFVVDQMGVEGRDNTNAMLQNLIPRMVAAGYQMKILPDAVSEWTGDAERLLGDVGRLFGDSNPSREMSDDPVESKVRALMSSNQVDKAIAVAREADAATQLTFEGPVLQLERLISEMATLPMPKAIIYFADSAYYSRGRILEAAIRAGVPIYAVKANGMPVYDPSVPLVYDEGSITTMALLSLSGHTGGKFSWGHYKASASDAILKRVETDLSCVYVLSIDAAALDRDRTLRPKVRLRHEFKGRLKAETISDFVIPNEIRLHGQDAAIALRSAQWAGIRQASVALVPIGFDKSRVKALIQFTVDAELGAPSLLEPWDVGVNYFGDSRVSGYGNMRVTFRPPKIVFDKTVSLPVGPYSIVGVAQEVNGHGMARGTGFGILERPKNNAVGFLHGLDVMQWGPGTFVSEGGSARKEGWSSLRYGMANSDRAISVVVSVCRGKGVQTALTIEKSLVLPDKELRFGTTDWPLGHNTPCLVVKDDLLAAELLPWSNRPYESTFVVKVTDPSGKTVATASKAFWIIGPTR